MITDRLIIRNFTDTKEDLVSLFEIMSDESVNKYLPWFPLQNVEDSLDFYRERILPRYMNRHGYYLAVCLKDDDKAIGYITVSGDDNHDFGYGLKKEFWGKGIITEAATSVIEMLIRDGYKYITATHDIHNIASGKVMQKLGMIYKYSYKEQWQPKDFEVTFRMYQLNFDGVDRVYKKYWEQNENHFIEHI